MSSPNLRPYSTDAPIEQVPVHWENRHLLSSFWAGFLLPSKFSNTVCSGYAARAANVTVRCRSQGGRMLYWTLVFLVIALIAGVLGFTGVAVAAAGVAKLLFVVFLILFVISLVAHLGRRRTGV